MTKAVKKSFAGKPAAKPNQGAGNKKNKPNFAKNNGVQKPKVANNKNVNKNQQQKKQPQTKRQEMPPKNVENDSNSMESDEDVKEGVAMFRGVPKGNKSNKKNNKKAEENLDSSNLNEDEDDSDLSDEEFTDDSLTSDLGSDEDMSNEEDEDDDEAVTSKSLDLCDLLGDSLVDEEDDDEFEGGDDDDDDDDDDDEDEDEDDEPSVKKMKKDLKNFLGKSKTEDEEEDDDDDDEMDDEEDDEEDDEDDEEADVSQKSPKKTDKKVKKEKLEKDGPKPLTLEERKAINERTVFISNVPKDIKTDFIEKIFKKYGEVESVRIRNIISEDPKMSKRLAFIKQKISPNLDTVVVYVVFVNKESAEKGLAFNGQKLKDNIVFTSLANNTSFDTKKAVFLGNLPFSTKVNDIHGLFSKCGEIQSIRIMRDKMTGMSRGFGYVNFSTPEAVTLAVELNGTKIDEREIRVKTCTMQATKRKFVPGKKQNVFKNQKRNDNKNKNQKFKGKAGSQNQASENKQNPTKQGQNKKQFAQKEQNKGFQGQKAELKKKNKPNKQAQEKKVMAKKLAVKKETKAQ